MKPKLPNQFCYTNHTLTLFIFAILIASCQPKQQGEQRQKQNEPYTFFSKENSYFDTSNYSADSARYANYLIRLMETDFLRSDVYSAYLIVLCGSFQPYYICTSVKLPRDGSKPIVSKLLLQFSGDNNNPFADRGTEVYETDRALRYLGADTANRIIRVVDSISRSMPLLFRGMGSISDDQTLVLYFDGQRYRQVDRPFTWDIKTYMIDSLFMKELVELGRRSSTHTKPPHPPL